MLSNKQSKMIHLYQIIDIDDDNIQKWKYKGRYRYNYKLFYSDRSC